MSGGIMAENDSERERKMDLTRRQWLLRLGRGVVLAGFSGAVGQLATDALAAPQVAGAAREALPPGLYLANNDHLTHALTSDDQFPAIPNGTETEYARPPTRPFVPQFFSQDEFAVVRRLAELLLGEAPATSPEASTPKITSEVAEWIDLIVAEAPAVRQAARRLTPEQRTLAVRYYGAAAIEELETLDPQTFWREGLGWVAAESKSRYGKAFLDLSQSEQFQLLMAMSQTRTDKPSENSGNRLFATLKSVAVRGYYTSRRGLDELDYKGNTYHAECPGCSEHS
jgi:hypothetical protein